MRKIKPNKYDFSNAWKMSDSGLLNQKEKEVCGEIMGTFCTESSVSQETWNVYESLS